MELSVSAKKIITDAQAFRVENDHNNLCVEHLLYGVLMLGKESSNDGKKVRDYLNKEMQNPDAALKQLKIDAEKDSGSFKDAAPVLGRATELAGKGEIGAMTIAQAVMESNTPTVLALKGLKGFHAVPEQNPPGSANNDNNDEKKQELSEKDLALLLLLLAAASNSQKDELVHNTGNRGNKPKTKRKTKMGLFTYRGGTVAAAIQYFLFGILVPVTVITVIQHFTHFLDKPATPPLMFVTGVLFCLWMFYLARGVALLFSMASGALGNFTNILCDVALIAALVKVIQLSFNMPAVPTWLKVIACIAVFLVLSIGNTLFDYLKDEGNVRKAKFTFMDLRGTPSKIFFQYVTRLVVIPFVVCAIIWIFRLTLPGWLSKLLMVFGFCYFWNILNTAGSCLVMSSESRGGKGKKFLAFVKGFVTCLFIPSFVIFLHKVFMWSPMKTWVIVVLAIYMVLMTIINIAYALQLE